MLFHCKMTQVHCYALIYETVHLIMGLGRRGGHSKITVSISCFDFAAHANKNTDVGHKCIADGERRGGAR